MTAALIKERYYILTPLSFLLGGLVLIATLLLAAASYLSSIDKTVAGYGHMLAALDAYLLQDMAQDNRRQLGVLERPWTNRPSLPGHRPSIPSGPLPISSSTTPTSSISTTRAIGSTAIPTGSNQRATGHRRGLVPDPVRPRAMIAVCSVPTGFDSARQVLTLIKQVKGS